MIKILSCLATEHDLRLVPVAAAVCMLGSWIAVRLYSNTRWSRGSARAMWVFLAGFAFGSSVWATHFLAMLAFDPGLPTGYEPGLTILSLFVAISAMILGFGLASVRRFAYMPVIGGAVLGLGVGAMHYTGMAALRIAGRLAWDIPLVAASIIVGVCFSCLALYVANRRKSRYVTYEVTALLVIAIVGHHFTGMGAITILPDPFILVPEQTMPIYMMAASVAGVSLLVIGTAFATYFVDNSSRSDAAVRIHHLAHFDKLTGLPNRSAFMDYVQAVHEKAKRENGTFAVLSIDLDRFKEVNDIFGHGVGDRVLAEVGRRLADVVGTECMIARLGGDEFTAVVASNLLQGGGAHAMAKKVMAAIAGEMVIDGQNILIGSSVGIAVYPEDGEAVAEVMANSDLAMYRAKESVGNRICSFERAMDEQVRKRRALGIELREALAREQFTIHYQVQKDVKTSRIVGYEALLRWRHPTRGSVSPTEFIPVAEETGLIIPIGEWVLREACREAATWPAPYRIAVNLSPVQFAQSDLPETVHSILLETGLRPSRLELEITESTLISDMSRTLHILRRLKTLGVTIAMDDFGTGYSSLSTLRAFPFDKIKIDRSFVDKVDVDNQAASIVRAILALGQSLRIPILAEGIETAEHLAFLRDEGCNEVQGYLLGHPRPIEDQWTEMDVIGRSEDSVVYRERESFALVKKAVA